MNGWPQSVRLLREEPVPKVRVASAMVSMYLAWEITPKWMEDKYSRMAVRTAEAWRRRLMSRRRIPLINRVPTMLAIAFSCTCIVDYAIALPQYGPSHSVGHTLAGEWAAQISDAVHASPRFQEYQMRVKESREKLSAGIRNSVRELQTRTKKEWTRAEEIRQEYGFVRGLVLQAGVPTDTEETPELLSSCKDTSTRARPRRLRSSSGSMPIPRSHRKCMLPRLAGA